MNQDPKQPRKSENDRQAPESFADTTPRREGGDDALAETNPTDNRADEKVIVNEQRSDKITNGASQTATNSSEISGADDDILDDH